MMPMLLLLMLLMRMITMLIMNSGAAAHGDYVFGWEGDSLQRAMDNGCNLNQDCPAAGLTVQQPDAYNGCNVGQSAPEQVDGWLDELPMGAMTSF